MATKLLYIEDFNLLESLANVLDVLSEDGKTIVVLDQTIFYPQGGGQPYDKGFMESVLGKFIVEEVRFVDGIVRHVGNFERGTFQKGKEVKCVVDEARRKLDSRLHSAGHVVDMAVTELKLDWVPGKGYHFLDGPYVEYAGSIEETDKEKIARGIEALCNKFIGEARETKLLFMPKEEIKSVCHFVPDYIPERKPALVVMYGDFGVPCGGTHVNNLAEIKWMTIRKIKIKKGNIQVCYEIERG